MLIVAKSGDPDLVALRNEVIARGGAVDFRQVSVREGCGNPETEAQYTDRVYNGSALRASPRSGLSHLVREDCRQRARNPTAIRDADDRDGARATRALRNSRSRQ